MPHMNVHPAGQPAPGPRPVTACFSVSALAHPGVMPRIMELFAKRGLVPSQWNSRVCGAAADEVQIDLQMDGMVPAETEVFAQCLRQIVCVERVLTSVKQPMEDARP